MEINITTPTLLFSAISLLMLAYTNRFLALADLVRKFKAAYSAKPDSKILVQIKNFQNRLTIIKNMQFFGVSSFVTCIVCMFFVIFNRLFLARIVFAISLVLLFISLVFSLIEIHISIDALRVELGDLDNVKDQHMD
jgi:Protein of unknown function (DUF2721).